jgi:hypothetical protein
MAPSEHLDIAALYLQFAELEAYGRSPLYEALARGVAGDRAILRLLAALPPEKRMANLLFAATRYLFETPRDWPEFRRLVVENADIIRRLMLQRSMQTNEPGRCATLLPVLSMLSPPLALIEVGASAGLCLLPDRYGYNYGGRVLRTPDGSLEPPVFPCAVDRRVPLPSVLPEIVWRAGLDLNPIDIDDQEETAWLKVLVWPEQTERLARLEAAMRVAAAYPPRLVRGDLRHDLEALAAEAPQGATLVVFHSAALVYADPHSRAEFVRTVRSLCDFWVANEVPLVFPEIAARVRGTRFDDRFLISVNGSSVAWADMHGASLAWIADPPSTRKRAGRR